MSRNVEIASYSHYLKYSLFINSSGYSCHLLQTQYFEDLVHYWLVSHHNLIVNNYHCFILVIKNLSKSKTKSVDNLFYTSRYESNIYSYVVLYVVIDFYKVMLGLVLTFISWHEVAQEVLFMLLAPLDQQYLDLPL